MRRLEEFIRDPSVPFYIWLRFLVGQRVQEQHRRHLGTAGRDVGREVSIYRGAMPGASTGALAARLLGKLTSRSEAAVRAERKVRLQEALNRMDPLDREILVLRHYEQMSNGDAAMALGLSFKAALTQSSTEAGSGDSNGMVSRKGAMLAAADPVSSVISSCASSNAFCASMTACSVAS